ncbi:sensor domain-containing diguanylate cyclase [Varunaivibrio sulfuroxidans]|uniref:PAS domain S-box-containing protein/diguanylate cyclase (GGDEF)-like protein n=1 Tax=Varunaivibrio sulfuroxidans TaxID=1773489 RepID=A0A4R3J7I0_9PROT|nr:diguanylate cyclase [Varunaivibrio sulfuroxidans]TCS61315.1 PAS domain S-box-containing protein/diguanylate cyclase (GGDEF)-like protein [Varunaivibrio sulfuroxidans]WES31071.1 diguanylate cyclase [Varunaivibrio sulfuroxidans]
MRLKSRMMIVTLAGVVFAALLFGLFIFTVRQDYLALQKQTTIRAESIARALEEHVLRTYNEAKDSLDDVGWDVQSRLRDTGMTRAAVDRALRNFDRLPSSVSVIELIAEDGKVLGEIGKDVNDVGRSYAKKAFFQAHKNVARNVGGVVTRDYRPPFRIDLYRPDATETWSRAAVVIVISRAVYSQKGFAGIVMAVMSPSFLDRFFHSFTLDGLDSMTVYTRGGVVLARAPFGDKFIGRSYAHASLFRKIIPMAPVGVTQGPKSADVIQRRIAHRVVSGTPFVVTVSVRDSWNRALWNSELRILLPLFTIAFVGVAVFGFFLSRYVRRLSEARKTLKAEVAFTSALLDMEGSILIVLNADGRIVRFNRMARAATGFALAEVLDTPMRRLLCNEDDVAAFEAMLVNVQGSAEHRETEVRIRRKDGRERTFLSTAIQLVSHRGMRAHVVISAVDVTEHKQREKDLIVLANTDGLTGIKNRRSLLHDGEREFRRAQRVGRPLSVMIFDLDHFKRINDTYGHGVGDRVLQAFVSSVQKNLRDIDIFGRIGGEEFAVVLPETTGDNAVAVAERIRSTVAEAPLSIDGDIVKFTVSIGIDDRTGENSGFEGMLARADEALYAAKKAGRNRTEVYKDGIR